MLIFLPLAYVVDKRFIITDLLLIYNFKVVICYNRRKKKQSETPCIEISSCSLVRMIDRCFLNLIMGNEPAVGVFFRSSWLRVSGLQLGIIKMIMWHI